MKCRGRPKCPRLIQNIPDVTCFKPQGVLSELDSVSLAVEELEALRLVDLEGLQQEAAAQQVGVSRRAFWVDLQNARRKVAQALIGGKAIHIRGGNYVKQKKEV